MTGSNIQVSREWWVERWLELLDSYRFKKRLERARVYAREGNVLSIEFKGPKVLARVQGTDPEPYQVSLSMDAFTDEEWSYVIETLSEKALFSAKMLAGEMPQNIEQVFIKNGLNLFPYRLDDIRSRCSCPDKANPCKHIGAIYYLLGDRFSEDPFVLFQLRGRSKEQIIDALRLLRGKGEGENGGEGEKTPFPASSSMPQIEQFWQYNEQLESSLVVIAPAPSSETILDVLGPIPLPSDGSENSRSNNANATVPAVMQYLKTVYAEVSQQAILSAMTNDS
ncbi:SWIM zinc finger family protein [Microcoleus sp. FACHB-68]|uniref:SWIM zinc finger family protein n=1 Tax=Microcoleus sp. FACHB-68 TaxID=2692826 RepID=UPI001688B8D0|nr:SWIM zinc finger family protein [Microcoleus sp. FACHB-68]MBD1940597.1 SWIM zinc finger family protein [Microcoleus sp. FACHB-68]